MDINILTNVVIGLLTVFVPAIFGMMMKMFARNDKIISDIVDEQKDIVKSMNNCQTSMSKEYVLKADYRSDMVEIKTLLGDQSKKIDQIWKSLRTDKDGKD